MTEENVVVDQVESVENTETTETSTEETTPSFLDTFEYSFDKNSQKVTSEDELKELVELGRYFKEKGRDGDNWLKDYAKKNNMSKSELLEAFNQQEVDAEIQTIADEETVSLEVAKKLRDGKLLAEKDMTNAQKQVEKKRQDEQMSLFTDKYSDVKELPQEVWDRFAKGDIDLVEAYDMFNKDSTISELKEKLAKYEDAETINTKNAANAELSTGSTTGNGQIKAELTAESIDKMSHKERAARWPEIKKILGMQ